MPTTLTLLALLSLFIVGVYWLQAGDLDRWFASQLASTKTRLDTNLSATSRQLGIATEMLRRDQRLRSLWAAADRDALLAETLPFLKKLREEYDISHLYFHNPELVNFLRVHSPLKNGDSINRQTALQAAASGHPYAGLELGPLGTFTLRHVSPWTIDDKLLGFIELGAEFKFIADAMSNVKGMRAILLIKKKYLDRQGWEKGMKMLGRPADWDLLPNSVIAGDTFNPIPHKILKNLAALETNRDSRGVEITDGDNIFRAGCIALPDVSGREVADIIIMMNITAQKAALHQLIIALVVASVLFTIVLLVSAYFWLQRLERHLADADRSVQEEAGLRHAYQQKYLNRIEAVNQLQEELLALVPVEEKFKRITDAAVRIFDLDFCRIWKMAPADLCDADCIHAQVVSGPHACRYRDQCLHLVASSGRYEKINGSHRRVPLDAYKIGRIASGREKSFLTNDVANDPRVHDHDWAKRLGLVSFAGYRLRDESNDPVGVFAVFAKHTILPDEDALLSHLAKAASQVILASRAEENLRRATIESESANQAKSRFIANISHELRTPLHGILSFATFGRKRLHTVDEETLGEYFKKIYRSGQNLLALVNDLLDLSKLESEQVTISLAPSNIHDLIRVVVEEFASYAEDRRIRIVYEGSESDGGIVLIDQERIAQVLRNLLGNAVKFSPDGGSVEISLCRTGNRLTISVTDHGLGIPEDELEDVFDKFIQSTRTRTGAGGTGLGLAICREIIAAHHGRIWATNQPGGGARLTFVIPCDPKEPLDWSDASYEEDVASV